jgi:hypothetical protein
MLTPTLAATTRSDSQPIRDTVDHLGHIAVAVGHHQTRLMVDLHNHPARFIQPRLHGPVFVREKDLNLLTMAGYPFDRRLEPVFDPSSQTIGKRFTFGMDGYQHSASSL